MGSETLPSACYIFLTNLVYPLTLLLTGIKREKKWEMRKKN